MLYLVATPIGNLADITFRAIEILRSCDYILCEDTRHSRVLLSHYKIDKPLKSFHQFSEASKEDGVISDLKDGKNIVLISDAGTPGISDPGERLVTRCRQENLPVSPIPGPCAAIAALCASGLDTTCFQFVGFLPRKSGELKDKIIEILHYPGTTICYESPNRLEEALEALIAINPAKKICVARELTKKFETIHTGEAQVVLNTLRTEPIKGEIVLLISGGAKESWNTFSPSEHVDFLIQTYDLSKKEAIKLAAEMRGVPKKEIYKQSISLSDLPKRT